MNPATALRDWLADWLARWFPRRPWCKCRRARCPPPLPVCRQCFNSTPPSLQKAYAEQLARGRLTELAQLNRNLRFLAGGNRRRPHHPETGEPKP